MANRLPLPFVVQPKAKPQEIRIGSEESGVLSITRYGYLTAGEKAGFQQVETGKSGQTRMLKLVTQIEKETKHKRDQILTDLGNITSDDFSPPEYLEPYLGDIVDCLLAFDSDTANIELVKASIMLMSRVDAEFTIDEAMKLHPDLLKGLAELFDAEEQRSLAALPSEYQEMTKDENETTLKAATSAAKAGKSPAQARKKPA